MLKLFLTNNIYLKKFIDKNLKVDCTDYELFAINIRYGRTANFGHEICQIKRGDTCMKLMIKMDVR